MRATQSRHAPLSLFRRLAVSQDGNIGIIVANCSPGVARIRRTRR